MGIGDLGVGEVSRLDGHLGFGGGCRWGPGLDLCWRQPTPAGQLRAGGPPPRPPPSTFGCPPVA